MARKSVGPWFWSEKNGWFVHHNGRRVNLRVKGAENEPQAVKVWHLLMAGFEQGEFSSLTAPPKPTASEPKTDATVSEVVDGFLLAKRGAVKAETHYVYACLLKHVTSKFGKLSANGVKSGTVIPWLNRLSVSASTRSDIGGVLASAFKWAEGEGLILNNPLKGFKRPAGESRGTKAVVTADTHARLCEAATPALRVLLTLLHETGARPSELARLTAPDVDLATGVAVLTEHKTAHHTGKPRLIALTPKAVELLQTQAEAHPDGPLLRNSKGRPWTKDGIGLAMRRVSKAAGVKAIAYGYRHGFATQALVKGIPDATVAALLGHTGTAMLHRHYSHLTSQAQAMREAVAKVRGG